MRLLAVFLAISISCSLEASAGLSKKGQMDGLRALHAQVLFQYGGMAFCREVLGIDPEKHLARHLKMIRTATTVFETAARTSNVTRTILSRVEYDQVLRAYVAAYRDGHLNIFGNLGDRWSVGLNTIGIFDEGRYQLVVAGTENFAASSVADGIEPGDEIVAIRMKGWSSARPVSDFAREERRFFSQQGTYSSQMFAALESILMPPPGIFPAPVVGDTVQVMFARRERGVETTRFTRQLPWISITQIQKRVDQAVSILKSAEVHEVPYSLGTPSVMSPLLEGLDPAEGQSFNLTYELNLDIVNGKYPDLEQVGRINAYRLSFNGGAYGVIRLPSFSPDSVAAVFNEIEWLARIFTRLQNDSTVRGLIIDLVDNGGGYARMLIELLKFFAPPDGLTTGTIDIRLSRTFQQFRETWSEMDATLQYLDHALDEWIARAVSEGRETTGPIPVLGTNGGIEPGQPGIILPRGDGPTFSKKTLILLSPRSGSAAEIFAKVLQVNGIAAVMGGTTTRGMGDPVYLKFKVPWAELEGRLPYGHMETSQGPIEKVGVLPNVYRPLRVADIQDGFSNYAYEVMLTVEQLAAGTATANINSAIRTRRAVHLQMAGGMTPNVRLREAAAVLSALHTKVAKFDGKPLEESAQALVPLYRKAFQQIEEFAVAFQEVDWILIPDLPLPRALTRSDFILASLLHPEDAADRLALMATLPRFKDQPRSRALMRALARGLNRLRQVPLELHGRCEAFLDAVQLRSSAPTS